MQQREHQRDHYTGPVHFEAPDAHACRHGYRQLRDQQRQEGNLLSRSDVDAFKKQPARNVVSRQRAIEHRVGACEQLRRVIHHRHQNTEAHAPKNRRPDKASLAWQVQTAVARDPALYQCGPDQCSQPLERVLRYSHGNVAPGASGTAARCATSIARAAARYGIPAARSTVMANGQALRRSRGCNAIA